MIRTIHALCVQVIGEELRLLLPHEREAMIYDLLHAFPILKNKYKRAKKAEQALRDHEARHADHIQLWQAARRWLERHKAHLVGDVPGLLLDRLAGGDFPDQSYGYVVVDEFQDLTPGEQELMFRLRSSGGQLVALGDPRRSIYLADRIAQGPIPVDGALSMGVWISLGLRTERHDFLTITAREVCPEPRQSIALVEGA